MTFNSSKYQWLESNEFRVIMNMTDSFGTFSTPPTVARSQIQLIDLLKEIAIELELFDPYKRIIIGKHLH